MTATLSNVRARAILDAAKAAGLHGQAKINPGMTREQMWEVLSDAVDPSADKLLLSIIAKNIVREFRKQAKAIPIVAAEGGA